MHVLTLSSLLALSVAWGPRPTCGQPQPPTPICTPDDVRRSVQINWFATGDCTAAGTSVTIVSSENGICNLNPSTPGFDNAFQSYRTTCRADGSGGIMQFCPGAGCSGACIERSFDEYTCQDTDPAFGSSSVSVDCFGQGEPVLVPGARPNPGFFTATYYSEEACALNTCPLGRYSVVEAPQELCHVVPNSVGGRITNTGYRVACAQTFAGGFVQYCFDR